jgi:DNA polymerase (family 10)
VVAHDGRVDRQLAQRDERPRAVAQRAERAALGEIARVDPQAAAGLLAQRVHRRLQGAGARQCAVARRLRVKRADEVVGGEDPHAAYGTLPCVDNAHLADRLDAFATLLELADANPYSARAYRRAAETIRSAPTGVSDLVRAGQVRRLRGIGGSIEAKLRELVETGQIAELTELERELAPGIVGLGRYLGLGAKRSVEIARALGVATPEELREAAAAGRLRDVPGVGPKIEAQILAALAEGPARGGGHGIGFSAARELTLAVAAALDGEVAGDARRWVDAPERLAVVVGAADPAPVLARFAELPHVVALLEAGERRAVGVTVEGVPLELVAARPEALGTELLRATGAPPYVAALEPLPDAPDEAAVYAALGLPVLPPELREAPFRDAPPALLEVADIRGDLHCHTTWSDGRASVEEMARAAIDRGYEYIAICDHTPAVGAVQGLTADDVRRQAEEIAAANAALAPFRVLRGIECDILPDGRLDLPDDVLAELDWVQASVHGGQRMPRKEMTARVEAALRNPHVSCLSHPTGRMIGRRPENAVDLERVYEIALEEGVALEVNGLAPRLDLSGVHVREAIAAGVRIVCSTDAHSVLGLGNMPNAVHTARRGWATAADVLNTRSADGLRRGRR